ARLPEGRLLHGGGHPAARPGATARMPRARGRRGDAAERALGAALPPGGPRALRRADDVRGGSRIGVAPRPHPENAPDRRRSRPQGQGADAGADGRAARTDSRPDPEPRRQLPARSLSAPRLHDAAGHRRHRGLRVHQNVTRALGRRPQEDRGDLLRDRHDALSSGRRRRRRPARPRLHARRGLTGTLREALAVGTPVVATDLEGNPELVTHGVTGLLVPPRRADALARALLEIIADPPRACAMALEGRRRVQARFSTAVKVERTEALYRRLLAEASAQQPAGDATRGHDATEALE